MKLFTAILLGVLVTLSFGTDSVRAPDTTYIGNTVKVEVESATKNTDDSVDQSRHDDILAETKKTRIATESMEDATWLMNWGTWVLAIFAVVAAFISWRTFKETQQQSKQELRAYVHPFKFASFLPTPGNRLRVVVEIKNFGKTPASFVRIRSSICIDKRDANPDVFGEYGSIGSIGPDGQFSHYVEEPAIVFSQEDKRNFYATNDYAIFATGEIRYKDFAGTERITRFQVTSSREQLSDVKNPATGEVVKALSCGISENASRNAST